MADVIATPRQNASRAQTRARALAFAAAVFAVVAQAGAVTIAETGTGTLPAQQQLWLVVEVNRSGASEPCVLLRLADGRLLARADDLQRWRLRPPSTAPVSTGGELFYALDDLPGLTYTVDDARQILAIDAPPDLFPPTRLNGRPEQYAAPSLSAPGAFLNYDASTQASGGSKQSAALFELGAFNRAGVGLGDFLVRDHGAGDRLLRLETRWTQDRPEALASLRIGDAITGSGSWSRAVRFGGIQWATDFGTRPDFVPFPLPRFEGEAALPSTVDLFVDNVQRLSSEVPPGPFSIANLPVVTGSGVATVVVRDLLGREQTVALPYYASPALLRAGLDDFSYEAGFVRNGFGIDSNDYGRFVAAGTQRHGFSDRLTGEWHAEIQRSRQTVGIGATLLIDAFGTFNAALAASRAANGNGALVQAGFQRQATLLSFGGDVELASPHFSDLGLADDAAAPHVLGRAYASLGLREHGTIGLSYAAQLFRDRDSIRVLDASYSVSLGRLGYLSLSAARLSAGRHASLSYSVTFTRPLTEDTSASAGLVRDGGATQAQVDLQRNAPVGDGYGYRIRGEGGAGARADAMLVLQDGVGTYTFAAEHGAQAWNFRAGAAGSVVRFDGGWYFSRRVDQAFAVVDVPGFPDVRVYADNQLVAKTGADGKAFIPRLRPYQSNPVRIEDADLPLDAEVDATQLAVVPALRSGALVQFPVRRARGGMLRIVIDGGVPMPAGAQVRIDDRDETAPVGLDGMAWLTRLGASNRVHVTWREQACDLLVLLAPSDEPVPQLGTYTCAGVMP